jgi:hypothetical protein
LNRAGRWRKILLTDSSTMLSIGLRKTTLASLVL